ncbi:MAG: RNA polymerase sigma factor [Gammaproteobacteria bacterium]
MKANTDTTDEALLCKKAANGDQSARSQLYTRHAPAVFTLALRMLCHRASAEEVLQDTFIKAFTRLDTFRQDAKFNTWLRRIAVNECLQLLRSPWRQRAMVLDEVASPDLHKDHQIDLARALGTLDPISRAVVWMHDVEGYTHGEIARVMGRSVSFSKSRLARGHVALRTVLEPESEASECTPILGNSSH